MIVLDCSAAVSLSLEGVGRGDLTELMLSEESVIAPDVFVSEVTRVMQKYALGGVLTRDDALERARACCELVDRLVPAGDLYLEALSESLRLGHSSYDMLYLVLARRTASTLFTLDRRLQDLCLKSGVSCVWGVKVDGERWTVRSQTVEGPVAGRAPGLAERG